MLVEIDGLRLLTDPVLRTRFLHLRRIGPDVDAENVGTLDAVLLSHLHHDHLDLWTLASLGRSLRIVAPAGAGALLRKKGFTNVEELARGDTLGIDGVAIRATQAEHAGRRAPFGADVPPVGFLLEGSKRIYFAGDTDLFDEMSELAPGLDVGLIPISGWGFRVPEGHLDPRRAAEALARLRPRIAVPIHWGTYGVVGFASGRTALRAPREFERHAAALAPSVDVRVLAVGESLEVPS